MLSAIRKKVLRSSIFISGAAQIYEPKTEKAALSFIHKLSFGIASKGYKIVSGVGYGIGSAVINGASEYIFSTNYRHLDDGLVLHPFPQVVTGTKSKEERNLEYRDEIISHAGLALFVFGNKLNEKGEVVPSDGMFKEFEIAVRNGVVPIPVGATGYASQTLWEEVVKEPLKYYPNNADLLDAIKQVGNTSLSEDELTTQILIAISILQNQF